MMATSRLLLAIGVVGAGLGLHGATKCMTGHAALLGTNDATCAHFDLAALAAGATVSIPSVRWGIRAAAQRLAERV